nr:DUF560 domain-containing protein [Desulfobulbaceae bacterium]
MKIIYTTDKVMVWQWPLALWIVIALFFSFLAPPASEAAEQLSTDKEQVESLFAGGMSAREGGDNDFAVEAFIEILNIDPTINRARLELALTYANIFEYAKALEQAEIVLKDPGTPPKVKASVLAFVAQLEADKVNQTKTSDWRFPLSFSYVYDNNINIGPSSAVIPGIGELNPNQLPQSDSGVELSAGVSHTFRGGQYVRSSSKKPIFLVLSGLNYYNRHYFNEDVYDGDYDLEVISVRTSPALVVPGKWRANLDLQADILYYGDIRLGNYYTMIPAYTLYFGEVLEVTGDVTLSKRMYEQSTEAGRDSDYTAPRLHLRYLGPNNRYAIQGIFEYFDEEADLSRFSNTGTSFSVAGALNISREFSASVSYLNRKTKYDGLEPGFPSPRDENQDQLSLGLNYTFSENLPAFANWTLGYNVTWTGNQSNVATTDYDRTFYNLSMSRSF